MAIDDPEATYQALSGIRVLAVEHFIAGPYASMWLADQGAQVIKIEPPNGGDQARDMAPSRDTSTGEPRSLGLLRSNRNKQSLTLDLKNPKGVAIFKELVETTDVVLENLRADSMRKLGLDYSVLQEIKPSLIYTSVSGFGHDDVLPGPYSGWAAFDVIVQALSGLMFRPEREGPRPAYLGFPLADIFAGALAYGGTMQALFERQMTGRGQHVDIAMYDGGIVLNELALATQSLLNELPESGTHFQAAPFGAYQARDGYIGIAVFSEKNWHAFCSAMGHSEVAHDPRFASGRRRAQKQIEIREIVESWLSSMTRLEAANRLREVGVAAAPVQDVEDLLVSPHAQARQMILPIEDPAWGAVHVAGNPIKTSLAGPTPTRPPPDLGEHTDLLLGSLLQLSPDDIQKLRADAVI